MKKCPACAEQIQDEAKKCRFCGTEFEKPSPPLKLGCGGTLAILVVVALAQHAITGDDQPNDTSSPPSAPIERPSVAVGTLDQARAAARDLFNEAGESCEAVTSLSPIAKIESGGVAIRANCTKGAHYALVLSDDNRLRFLSDCAVFLGSTGHRC